MSHFRISLVRLHRAFGSAALPLRYPNTPHPLLLFFWGAAGLGRLLREPSAPASSGVPEYACVGGASPLFESGSNAAERPRPALAARASRSNADSVRAASTSRQPCRSTRREGEVHASSTMRCHPEIRFEGRLGRISPCSTPIDVGAESFRRSQGWLRSPDVSSF